MRRLSMISQFIHGKDKPVLRPGESHEGVGRKKNPAPLSPVSDCLGAERMCHLCTINTKAERARSSEHWRHGWIDVNFTDTPRYYSAELCVVFCGLLAGSSVSLVGFFSLPFVSGCFVWFVCWFWGVFVCCRLLPCASDRRLARCTSSFFVLLAFLLLFSLLRYLGVRDDVEWPFHPYCPRFLEFVCLFLLAPSVRSWFGSVSLSSPAVLLVVVGRQVVESLAGRSHGLGCAAASNAGVPGLLSVGQSGAPSCSKDCSHGIRGDVLSQFGCYFYSKGEWNAPTGRLPYFGCTSLLQCTAGTSESRTL